MKRECKTCMHNAQGFCLIGACSAYKWWKPIPTRDKVLSLIDKERNRQDIKWGEQNHAQQAWVGILGEEFGEYCQAVNETYLNNATKKHEGGYENLLKELTHVAAVAVGAMESLMRNREEEK